MDDDTKMDVSTADRKPINGVTAIDETLIWTYEAWGATSYCVPLVSRISVKAVLKKHAGRIGLNLRVMIIIPAQTRINICSSIAWVLLFAQILKARYFSKIVTEQLWNSFRKKGWFLLFGKIQSRKSGNFLLHPSMPIHPRTIHPFHTRPTRTIHPFHNQPTPSHSNTQPESEPEWPHTCCCCKISWTGCEVPHLQEFKLRKVI